LSSIVRYWGQIALLEFGTRVAVLLADLFAGFSREFDQFHDGISPRETGYHVAIKRVVHNASDVHAEAGKQPALSAKQNIIALPTYPTGSNTTITSAITARLTIRRLCEGNSAMGRGSI
jgi:hypothetical protein